MPEKVVRFWSRLRFKVLVRTAMEPFMVLDRTAMEPFVVLDSIAMEPLPVPV